MHTSKYKIAKIINTFLVQAIYQCCLKLLKPITVPSYKCIPHYWRKWGNNIKPIKQVKCRIMSYFPMKIFHTLQHSNSEDSLQRTATKRQLSYTWIPGGCVVSSSHSITVYALIIKESKAENPWILRCHWSLSVRLLRTGTLLLLLLSFQLLQRGVRRNRATLPAAPAHFQRKGTRFLNLSHSPALATSESSNTH